MWSLASGGTYDLNSYTPVLLLAISIHKIDLTELLLFIVRRGHTVGMNEVMQRVGLVMVNPMQFYLHWHYNSCPIIWMEGLVVPRTYPNYF